MHPPYEEQQERRNPDVMTPQRGHIYRMKTSESQTLYCLVVIPPGINGLDDECKAVRVTVTHEHHSFPYWVRLSSGDPVSGYVVVHDLSWVGTEELESDLGEVSMETMVTVKQNLRRMFDL